MPPMKSHADWRQLVCVMCLKQKNFCKLNDRWLNIIKNAVNGDNLNPNIWDWLPTKICVTCINELRKREKKS